jgi:hypothetical protein
MVIYVDRNNTGLNGIAQALGGALGQGLTAQYQQDQQKQMGQALQQALQQAQGMPPDQQAPFMLNKMGQFGPQGEKFVDLYMKMQTNAAESQRATAETAKAQREIKNMQTIDQLNQFKLNNAGHEQALHDRVEQSEVEERHAAAVGDYAGAAAKRADTARTMQQLKQEQTQGDITNRAMTNLMGDLNNGQAQAPAAGQGQSPATPQSYTPGSTGNGGVVQKIGTSVAAPTTGTENSPPGDTGDSPKNILSIIDLLSHGGDPIKAIPPVKLTAAQKQEIVMRALGGAGGATPKDIAEALRLRREMGTPTNLIDAQYAPGVIGKKGLVNGEEQWVPGSLEYKPGKTTDQLLRSATGASVFQDTNQTMKAISDAIPDGGAKGDDPLGGTVFVRKLNRALIDHSFTPIGADRARSLFEAYKAVYDYHIMGISLMLPSQRAQTFLNAIKLAAPSPTEAKEVRDQKMKATELTADLIISSTVNTALASGIAVPPDLMSIYKERGLVGTTPKKLRDTYLASFDALNMPPPIDPETLSPSAQEPGAPGNGGVYSSSPDVPRGGPPAQEDSGWTFTPFKEGQ